MIEILWTKQNRLVKRWLRRRRLDMCSPQALVDRSPYFVAIRSKDKRCLRNGTVSRPLTIGSALQRRFLAFGPAA
jgi:hypothetical protein